MEGERYIWVLRVPAPIRFLDNKTCQVAPIAFIILAAQRYRHREVLVRIRNPVEIVALISNIERSALLYYFVDTRVYIALAETGCLGGACTGKPAAFLGARKGEQKEKK